MSSLLRFLRQGSIGFGLVRANSRIEVQMIYEVQNIFNLNQQLSADITRCTAFALIPKALERSGDRSAVDAIQHVSIALSRKM